MARAADQFRSSDVTFWALAALGAWAFAVLAANLSGLMPTGALAALHASRLDAGTITQVRDDLGHLRQEADRLRRENILLLQRFDLAEQARSEVTRRVGALEAGMPQLIERLAAQPGIDRSVTATLPDTGTISYEAQGGSVSVRHRPLLPLRTDTTVATLDTPAASLAPPTGNEFGVALGFPLSPNDAEGQWQNLLANVGTLLIGLRPVLTDTEQGDSLIVAGPIPTRTEADMLCDRLGRVGIPCAPVPFAGAPLPLLN